MNACIILRSRRFREGSSHMWPGTQQARRALMMVWTQELGVHPWKRPRLGGGGSTAIAEHWGSASLLPACLVAMPTWPGCIYPTWPAGMERITLTFHKDGRWSQVRGRELEQNVLGNKATKAQRKHGPRSGFQGGHFVQVSLLGPCCLHRLSYPCRAGSSSSSLIPLRNCLGTRQPAHRCCLQSAPAQGHTQVALPWAVGWSWDHHLMAPSFSQSVLCPLVHGAPRAWVHAGAHHFMRTQHTSGCFSYSTLGAEF